jgi:hypothetical protein
MTPFEVYVDYLALKNHFTTEWYDYIKYNGKTKANAESFQTRKDRMFFEKLAKHRDPHGLMLANFVANPKVWARDLAYSQECEQTYLDWLKKTQALANTVRNDLSHFNSEFNSNFIVKDNYHPKCLQLYLGGDITRETFTIVVDVTGCFKYWDKNLADDIMWQDTRIGYSKYIPFLKYDRAKIKKVLIEYFGE